MLPQLSHEAPYDMQILIIYDARTENDCHLGYVSVQQTDAVLNTRGVQDGYCTM